MKMKVCIYARVSTQGITKKQAGRVTRLVQPKKILIQKHLSQNASLLAMKINRVKLVIR